MHDFVSFNSQIIPAKKSFLSVVSPAAFYGKSIFTTVAIYHSKPFLWSKHWFRLVESAKKLKIDLSEFTEQTVKNSLSKIISLNKITDGRARLTFFDQSTVSIWQNEQKIQTSFLINSSDFRAVPPKFRLTISPFRINSTSPISNIKSGNYLENILALENAREKKIDEAVRLNESEEIVSACMANIFWLKGNRVFTPNLQTGCLRGTTREFILEKFTVQEKRARLNDLFEAEQIFLTSSGIGIVQVAEFEGRILNRESHKIMHVLNSELNR